MAGRQARHQGGGGRSRTWLGTRSGVVLAVSTTVLTLAVFAAVARVVSHDNGWLSGDPPSARIAQVHGETQRSPLLQVEEPDQPKTRVALAHDAVMQSPWKKIANDITEAILPGYRRDGAIGVVKTRLVEFDTAPFPYDGPVVSRRMAYAAEDAEKKSPARGRLFRQKDAYSDRRVLLHIPRTFDVKRPAVMVVFFHGHRATLTRDVLNRQQVAAQISASGVNAVLVAPQFAVSASDSSPGNLGEPGGFKRFVDEAGKKLAQLHGNQASARAAFANMPVVLVAYSGGYLASAWSLHHGGVEKGRVRGVVLLDALYGEFDKFAAWIADNRQAFFVSAYIGTGPMRRRNSELMQLLQERDVPFATEMPARNRRDNVFFVATGTDVNHTDFVTNAWTPSPIKDVLQKHAGRLMGSGPVARSAGGAAVR